MRRTIIVLAVLALVFLVVAGVLYRRFTDSARVRADAEAYLQRFFGTRVSVKSASFSFLEGVQLHGVAIQDPYAEKVASSGETLVPPNSSGTVFYCESIKIEHDPWAALGGKLVIRSLIAEAPICTIVHDADRQETNLSTLFSRLPNRSASPMVMPTIELRDARVRVLSMRVGQLRTVENLHLTVRGRPSSRNDLLYDIAWQSGDTPNSSGISQVDLSTGLIRNVRGGLPSMSVEAVMLAINAKYDGVSAWRDLLGLGGKVSARDYNLIGHGVSQEGRSATIELDNATVSIPSRSEEVAIPAERRYLRFTNVNGTVYVTEKRIHAHFSGTFHGAQCSVSITLTGDVKQWKSLDDVAFDAEISVKHLSLPSASPAAPKAEQVFIHGWKQLERFYEKFDPSGPLDLTIAVSKKAGAAAPVTIKNAELIARGASTTYHRYPYHGKNVHGNVRLMADGVWIHDLCTKHDGGTVCVDGWLANTNPGTAARITISGENVPIDDALFGALGPRYQKIREDFAPSGRIDLTVSTSREQGTAEAKKPWYTEIQVAVRDATATYRRFPYTLNNVAGHLQIASGRVELTDVVGHSTDGVITINGSVAFNPEVSDSLALRIVGERIPLDEKLIAALPADRRSAFAALQAQGRVNIVTQLTRNASGQVVPTSKVALEDTSIRPDFFPIPITDITGPIEIAPNAVQFNGVTGRYGKGRLSLSGSITKHDPSNQVRVSLEAQGLAVDGPFRQNAPKAFRRVLSEWRVTGPIDAHAQLQTAEDGTLRYDVTTRLSNVSVEHEMFPIPFTNVRGVVHTTNSGSSSSGLRGEYGGADISAKFETHSGGKHKSGRIELSAENLTLGKSVRGVLSPRLRASWDTMQPTGTVDLRFDELTYEANEEGKRRWEIDGDVVLHAVDIPGVLEMKKLGGTLALSGSAVDDRGGTLLSGTIHLSRGAILGKSMTDATAKWQYARAKDGNGRILFSPINASVYQGQLTGNAEVMFDRAVATYSINTIVQSMRVGPFLADTDRIDPSEQPTPEDVDGLANVQLRLSGTVGKESSRRGDGSIEIVDGRIYQLPLVLAIFNSLQINPPEKGAFDQAQARFFVEGSTVSFDELVLRGRLVSLIGTGTLKLPEYSIDLNLVNISPDVLGRFPVLTDLFEGASRQLMGVRVIGPLSGPRVRVRPLPKITDEIRGLFQRRRNSRVVTP